MPKKKLGKLAITYIIISIVLSIGIIVIAENDETKTITGGFLVAYPWL